MERKSRRRRRPAMSCLECRRRKIKCNRGDTCTHCVATKTQCIYKAYVNDPPVQQGQSSQQRSTEIPNNISCLPVHEPYPPADRSITQDSNHSSASNQNDAPDDLRRHNMHLSNYNQDVELNLQDLLRRVQKLEQSSVSSSIHHLPEAHSEILTNQAKPHDSQIVFNKTRISRWSDWMGIGIEFAPTYTCYTEALGKSKGAAFQGAEIRAQVVQIGDLLQKCKTIATNTKTGRPTRWLVGPEINLTLPSREVADIMVALYFRSFDSIYRMFHVPTFWTDYWRYWDHPKAAKTDLRLKILLVIGIGSCLYDHGNKTYEFRNMVHQWIYAAQMWLSGPLEKDRLQISGLQIHCLTILARQIFSVGGDLVWMSMGSLIHRAMQIGFHCDPKHLPPMPLVQAETRRRLWATILEMVLQSSLDSAMPPRISFGDFDTEAPSNNNDDEIDEWTTSLQPHPKSTYTATSIQLILLDSLPSRLRILQILTHLHSELSYLDVLKLSSEITKVCQAYNSFIKENEISSVTLFHRNMLDFLIRRFMIPLHCPFIRKARTNSLFYYSLKASLDASIAIVSPELDQDYSRLMAIGSCLFKEGIRLSATIISLELFSQIEAQQLDGTLHRNFQSREDLKEHLKHLILLALERIRQGETNVKSHFFLSMILAQVEAMETGTSVELRIAQSGRDSLQTCYALLQTLPCVVDQSSALTSLGGGENSYDLDIDLGFFFSDASFS